MVICRRAAWQCVRKECNTIWSLSAARTQNTAFRQPTMVVPSAQVTLLVSCMEADLQSMMTVLATLLPNSQWIEVMGTAKQWKTKSQCGSCEQGWKKIRNRVTPHNFSSAQLHMEDFFDLRWLLTCTNISTTPCYRWDSVQNNSTVCSLCTQNKQ